MPFVHCIAEQDASVIVSPRVGCQSSSSSTSTKAAAKTTQDFFCNQQNHQEAELFEQWGALIEREGNDAYVIYDTIQDLGKVEDEARQQLCIRCYSLVDRYEIDRSVVAIAMSMFDRLISSGMVKKRREWAIIMTTCLYIAIKVNGCHDIGWFGPQTMANVGIDVICGTGDQIIAMESRILGGLGLDWMVNPPIPQNFLDVISEPVLKNHPMGEYDFDDEGYADIDGKVRHTLCTTAYFLCELSSTETFFSTKMPSSIAVGSVLVAMDVMRFPGDAVKWFLSLPLDHDPDEANLCAQRFHQIYSEEGHQPEMYWSPPTFENSASDEDADGNRDDDGEKTPRTITPSKDDELPSNLKRMRQTIDARSIEEEEGMVESQTKKRKK